MTVEKRTEALVVKFGQASSASEIITLIESALRDQIEDCAKIVNEEYKMWEDEGFKVHECFRDAEKRIRALAAPTEQLEGKRDGEMNARERAKQSIEQSALSPDFSQWWAIAISPEQSEALVQSIEKAITTAIEEDRKTRECCKAAREACLEIVKKEIERWDRESVGELEGSIEIDIRAGSAS